MTSEIFKRTKGFSLIELIVAVSIIVIITSVALFHQAQFSSDILITNAAYEVALTIRQAQVYGISSRGSASTQPSDKYRSGYGVHFEADTAKTDFFQMFIDVPATPADSNADAIYNFYYNPTAVGGANADAEASPPSPIGLTQGQHIRRFCAHSGAVWDCWNGQEPMSLDIVFVKPNPDANIVLGHGTTYTGNCVVSPSTCASLTYDKAKIVIESGLGDKCRTVRIYSSGQISVDPADPANPAGCDWTTES